MLKLAIEKAFEGREYSIHHVEDEQAVARIKREQKQYVILGNHGLVMEWLDKTNPIPTMVEALAAIDTQMQMIDRNDSTMINLGETSNEQVG